MKYSQSIEFKNEEGRVFDAYLSACWKASDMGYSYGSMSHPHPTALIKGGSISIAKWKNLTAKQRAQVDGIIEGDFRNGPVFLRIK